MNVCVCVCVWQTLCFFFVFCLPVSYCRETVVQHLVCNRRCVFLHDVVLCVNVCDKGVEG
jgi:hypothetical protein